MFENAGVHNGENIGNARMLILLTMLRVLRMLRLQKLWDCSGAQDVEHGE